MQPNIGKVWLPRRVVDDIIAEAKRTYPLETGGILLGYWSSIPDEVVVTGLIGPGPGAIHEERRFVPDADFQEACLEQLHLEAPHRFGYLGDWHSHPCGGIRLSALDRQTLRTIAQHEEAYAPVPLMGVVGRGNPWLFAVWRFISRRNELSRSQREYSLLKPHIYI